MRRLATISIAVVLIFLCFLWRTGAVGPRPLFAERRPGVYLWCRWRTAVIGFSSDSSVRFDIPRNIVLVAFKSRGVWYDGDSNHVQLTVCQHDPNTIREFRKISDSAFIAFGDGSAFQFRLVAGGAAALHGEMAVAGETECHEVCDWLLRVINPEDATDVNRVLEMHIPECVLHPLPSVAPH